MSPVVNAPAAPPPAADHNLDVALAHARAGIRVFPCRLKQVPPYSKHAPHISSWQDHASCHEATIRGWWAQWPGAVPGRIGPVTVDCDRKPGKADGVKYFYELGQQHGEADWHSWAVTATPNNGLHFSFAPPAGAAIGNAEGALKGHGINIRGSLSGYCICEGARCEDGREYKPIGKGFLATVMTTGLPALPQWIIDLIRANSGAGGDGFPSIDPAALGAATDLHRQYAAEKIASMSAQLEKLPAKEGAQWNNELNTKALMLGGIAGCGWCDPNEAGQALYDACFKIGMYAELGGSGQHGAIVKTIRSGIGAGMRKPGGKLFADFPEWKAMREIDVGVIFGDGPKPASVSDLRGLPDQQADPADEDPLDRAAREAVEAAMASEAAAPAAGAVAAPALGDAADDAPDGSRQLQGSARLREIRRELLACVPASSPESSPWMSRLIDANCEAMKLPFRKFALLATIAFMGGLLGRKYKTECGLSAAQSFVLVAPSGTGKGLALGYWPKKFIAARNPRRMRKGHVINGSISSVESLHGDVQHTGTTIHYRPDAGSDLKAIAKPMSKEAERLRDRIYEFYDASGHGEPEMFPASSIAAKKRGDRPIRAAQFCSIWSTTPTIFTSVYSSDFLSSGGGQRLLISFHDEHGGDPIPDDEVAASLPDDIREWLSRLLDDINDLDTAYFKASKAEYPTDDAFAPDFDEAEREAKRAAELTVIVRYDEGAKAAAWRLDQAVATLMREINSKRLPAHYAMFGRVGMSARRLALISAVLRDRERPLIGEVDIAWGLAFALDCFVSLAASFDRGDSGDATDGARESAISEWFERSSKSREVKHGRRVIQDGWVPFWWLKDRAQNNNAFKERNKGSDELLLKALEMMVRGGQLEKSVGDKGALKFKMIGE